MKNPPINPPKNPRKILPKILSKILGKFCEKAFKKIIRNLPYSAAPNKRRAALIVSNVFPPRKLCSSLIYFHWAYKVKFPILSSIKVTDS